MLFEIFIIYKFIKDLKGLPASWLHGVVDNILKNSQKIIITTHLLPDLDAMSSLLATAHILRKAFPRKRIYVILEDHPLENLSFLPDFECIRVKSLNCVLHKVDTVFFLDGTPFSRFSKDSGILKQTLKSTTSICIDHHDLQTDKEKYNLFISYTNSSSTSDIIFDIFIRQLHLIPLDRTLAKAFIVGIWGDTGFGIYGKNLGKSLNNISILVKKRISHLSGCIRNFRLPLPNTQFCSKRIS